ncbi:patatin-like phospholipase family protein [Celeribacter indicus]|uniref:Phospholipase, patatin family protein n=1 Tax=Celeribacter indicus TaxID=1208324 RepID=A0A0B5DTD9_9RHOB|nr:patatin-like phospholipase family protein [Celeribacter indicus]AJE46334.1 phospholipase, patatin family protein [Celeribacter indicus]SDW53690.1 NTE family protein [Celeribacter indicus]
MTADNRGTIGLALGSGGARGLCHIGVLRELEEMGIVPGLVAGCSMGALVGAAWAAGRLDQLEAWMRAVSRRSFSRLALLDLGFSGGGLIQGREILALLEEIGLPERIEDLPVPFAAVATDLETGREVWLREGSLALAVRASVSMPGVIAPLYHQSRWLIDGGMVNPVPVSLARALGAEAIIASNPNARLDGRFWRAPEPPERSDGLSGFQAYLPEAARALFAPPPETGKPQGPGYLEVLSASIDIMTDHIRRARLAGEPPQVLLSANLRDMTVFDFQEAERAIVDGRRMVREQAPALRGVAGGAPGAESGQP